MLQNA